MAREPVETGGTAEFVGFDEANAQLPEAVWLALLPHFLAVDDPALVQGGASENTANTRLVDVDAP